MRVDDTGAAATSAAPHRWQLAANTRREAFRAMLLPADGDGRGLTLSPEAAIALGVYAGDTLRVAPLELEGGGGNGQGSEGSRDGGRHE
jgi:arginine/ornithine N-succinyltransferase beta subunit